MKLGTLIYHGRSSSKQKLQVCNNKHPRAIKTCKWCFVPMVSPLTMKLGILMYHGNIEKLQVERTASGNNF